VSAALQQIEDIIDASGAAEKIEALLPQGARGRQLPTRTLLAGMMLALEQGRPAHLTRMLAALTSLPETDQKRLGITEQQDKGPHQLTYRQAENTFALVTGTLGKDEPDGAPARELQEVCDLLLEASIPPEFKTTSASLAVDWTDLESWSRPPPHGSTVCADPEAHWGHRNSNLPGPKGEMFFGYYISAATMVPDEDGQPVPELARRMTAGSCKAEPARAVAGVLAAMPAHGIPLGDVIADSGCSHRLPGRWANPLRRAGAQMVVDLHPSDRGPHGTCQGAVVCNGCLYCPATPGPLLQISPLQPGASAGDVTAHDARTAELSRYKLGVHAAEDADGYRRLACPATTGKIRCPLRPQSMALHRDRPEILAPPQNPPACCTQQTITAGPQTAEKTRQKHDYPGRAWRLSYNRRTAAERLNSTIKDPATTSISRGWIRLMGLTAAMLWTACLLAVRNLRILNAWQKRQDENARRAAKGLPPRTRSKRRQTTAAATTATTSPADPAPTRKHRKRRPATSTNGTMAVASTAQT